MSGSLVSVALTAGTSGNLAILKEMADFWKIPYSTTHSKENGELLLSSGMPDDLEAYDDETVVVIPSSDEEFQSLAAKYDLQTVKKRVNVTIPVAPGASTTIQMTATEFQGARVEPLLTSHGNLIFCSIRGTRTKLATLDIVNEYRRHVYEGLEDRPSRLFRIASLMPSSYGLIPPQIRNWSLRRAWAAANLDERLIGPVECLRTIFLASILLASGRPVPRIGFWERGIRYVVSITHDIESRKGLETGARNILEVETKLGIQSTWNLPSNRYPIQGETLADLANSGEIGAHDTRHDGRLILNPPVKKTERAAQSKQSLELATKASVTGFRSPLLQHNRELLAAIERAGYEYDSSVPSWEPVSPTSQNPHGIGTVFPLQIDGITEIPVTLPQDHQCLRIIGLSPAETVDELLHLSAWIRMIGGACIILVHPDYEFGQPENKTEYTRLLEEFRKDPECKIVKMRDIARWWSKRSQAYIDLSGGETKIRSRRSGAVLEDLDLQIVTRYTGNGFEIKAKEDAMPMSAEPIVASREV